MTIGELTVFRPYTQTFFNYDAFIFASYPLYFSGPGFWNTWFGVADDNNSEKGFVLSFRRSPNFVYDIKFTYADCFSTEQSFYWDNDNQILYVHIEHDITPNESEFIYGLGVGVSDTSIVDIDGISYEPLIQNNIQFRQQQDIINYSKPSFVTATQDLSNDDARLDYLLDENIFGNEYDLYYLDDEIATPTRSDLQQLQKFVVSSYTTTLDMITLNLKDTRQAQDRQVPDDVFTVADYPDIDPEIANTVIPLTFGTPREQTAICTNSTTTSGNVEYRQALSLTSLGTVYVKNGDTWTSVTPSATSVSTGEFTLSAGDARDSNGTPFECRVDGSTGISATYSSDIIKYLNTTFLGLTYSDSYYDTTEWEAEETSLDPVAYVLDEKKLISTVAIEIQNGSNTGFRYETNQSGKQTIRIDSENRSISKDIPNVEIQDIDVLKVVSDPVNLAAEIRVKYNKSFNSGRYLSVFDDSLADTVEETYKQRPYKEFPTFLTSSTNANKKVTYIQNQFSMVRGIFEGTLMGADKLDIRIYDLLNIEITPGVVDLDTETITGREYYGLALCKVLSVDPDLQNKENRITAVIIGTAQYYQQFLQEQGDNFDFEDGETWFLGR